jgi:hypothetical protein
VQAAKKFVSKNPDLQTIPQKIFGPQSGPEKSTAHEKLFFNLEFSLFGCLVQEIASLCDFFARSLTL